MDVDACVRVLAAARDGLLDEAAQRAVEQAATAVHQARKKRLKVARRTARAAADRELTASARRYQEQAPSPMPEPPAGGRQATSAGPLTGAGAGPVEQGTVAVRKLARPRRCYVCKEPYRRLHADYHLLCLACAEENLARRMARCDLRGRRAVVTGGRIKIGFHTALKLLRDGAEVLVTTRFPGDSARRFAAVPDADGWLDRLHVHGVDFLDPHGVGELLDAIQRRWSYLDILVNNAAQTVRRPAAYHRELRAAEALPLDGTAAAIDLAGALAPPDPPGLPAPAPGARPAGMPAPARLAGLEALFPAGRSDETGEPLDLRPSNSWALRLHEVDPAEWLEVHVINAFVPFLLTTRLRPLLQASPRPDRYVVQVSAMEGSFSRDNKTVRHPHTNMAKAGLNMLTRTAAADYERDGIYMNSVDTGWVTDERPHPVKAAERAAGFRPPLDVIDGAARVYDPVVRGVRGEPVAGKFLKDYRPVGW